jgi:hypothetical protein
VFTDAGAMAATIDRLDSSRLRAGADFGHYLVMG